MAGKGARSVIGPGSEVDWDTTTLECIDESASGRAGPPVPGLGLFADFNGERLFTSKNLV